jgi:hypothetical protein
MDKSFAFLWDADKRRKSGSRHLKSWPKIFEISHQSPPPLTGEGQGGGESADYPPPLYPLPQGEGIFFNLKRKFSD